MKNQTTPSPLRRACDWLKGKYLLFFLSAGLGLCLQYVGSYSYLIEPIWLERIVIAGQAGAWTMMVMLLASIVYSKNKPAGFWSSAHDGARLVIHIILMLAFLINAMAVSLYRAG